MFGLGILGMVVRRRDGEDEDTGYKHHEIRICCNRYCIGDMMLLDDAVVTKPPKW